MSPDPSDVASDDPPVGPAFDPAAVPVDQSVPTDPSSGALLPAGTTDPAQVFPDPSLPPPGTGVPETGVSDPLTALADGVHRAVGDALAALTRVWTGSSGEVDEGAVDVVSGPLTWYLGAAAVASVLVAGGRMAWQRRGQPGAQLVRGLGTLVLVSGAALAAVGLAVTAADGFARWVLAGATDDLATSFDGLLAADGTTGLTPVLGVLVDSSAVVAVTVQILLLVARLAALVLLTGALPLTAAALNTETGRRAFTRATSWLVALVLFQPAAALVLAVSFRVAPTAPGAEDPLVRSLTGTALLVMVVACLPVLLRLLGPAVATVLARGGEDHGTDREVAPSGARPLPAGAIVVGSATVVVPRASMDPGGSATTPVAPPRLLPVVVSPVSGRMAGSGADLSTRRPGFRAEAARR